MKARDTTRRYVAVLVCLLAALVLAGCDWSMWRGDPAGTGVSPDPTFTPSNVANVTLAWSVPIAAGLSQPLVAGSGIVVVPGGGAGGADLALDPGTGQTRWTSSLLNRPVSVVNGVVYGSYSTDAPENGEVRALDTATGVARWSRSVGDRTYPGAAIAADGYVFVVASENGGSTQLFAFDAHTGVPAWSYGNEITGQLATVRDGTVYVVDVSPVFGDTDQHLVALDEATGTVRWTARANRCGQTAPVVTNGKVYVNGDTFDAATGAPLWSWPVCPGGPFVAVTADTVFVPSLSQAGYPQLVAFAAGTGTSRWTGGWGYSGYSNGSGLGTLSAPAIANGVVFGTQEDHLIALDAVSGAPLWASPSALGQYGDPIVANGFVYAAVSTNRLEAYHLPG